MGAPPMGAPPMGHAPPTAQVQPLHQAPPYLASETAARMDAPVDPWEGSLKLVMIVFGLILIACFAAPWAIGEKKMLFSWDTLKGAPTIMKVMTIMLVGTGALAVILSLLPLASMGRGIAAALLGLAPLTYAVVGAGSFKWKALVVTLGTVGIVGGLLIRSQYRAALVGRILVTVGVIAVLLYFLVPESGGKPELVNLFKQLGSAAGKAKVGPILGLLPFFLAVVSLLVWIPSSSSAMGTPLAWSWIVLPMVISVVGLVVAGNIGTSLKVGLFPLIWAPASKMAWTALVGYGVAVVVGKNLEHS